MGLFNLPRVDANLSVYLILDGKEYEVSHFNTSFNQSVDFKGQPQSEIRGGRISVGLTQVLPESLYRWAMDSQPKDGQLVFRSQSTEAPLRIKFANAYCVNFERVVNQHTGITTKISISPDELLINDISFDNHWV